MSEHRQPDTDTTGTAEPVAIDGPGSDGPAGERPYLLGEMSTEHQWLRALLRHDDSCWVLVVPDPATTGVVREHRNRQIRDGDLPAAQAWASELLNATAGFGLDAVTGQRVRVWTVGVITEWRPVQVGLHRGWAPLFTDTDRFGLPFGDLHPATSVHCAHRGLTANIVADTAAGWATPPPAGPAVGPQPNAESDYQMVAGCPIAAARAARYTAPDPDEVAQGPRLLSSLAVVSHWIHALLMFTDGRWAVYEPDRCFTSVSLTAYNDRLRDPGDVDGAQRWAAGYLDALEDRFRAGHDLVLLADDPLRRVTEWRPVIVDTVPEVHGSAWLPLYSHTPVCVIPFRGLRAATGAVCTCQHPGGER